MISVDVCDGKKTVCGLPVEQIGEFVGRAGNGAGSERALSRAQATGLAEAMKRAAEAAREEEAAEVAEVPSTDGGGNGSVSTTSAASAASSSRAASAARFIASPRPAAWARESARSDPTPSPVPPRNSPI